MQSAMVGIVDVDFWIFLFSVTLIFCLVVQILVKIYLKPNKKTIHHPPSPFTLPIIGHMHLLGSNMQRSFQTLASRYGPLMAIRIGSSTSFVVSNAAVAKEIFKTNDLVFSCRAEFASSDYGIYQGSSFFAAEYGTYWRFVKRMCMTEVLSPTQLNKFTDIRREEILKLMEALENHSKRGEECEVGMMLGAMTNNIICRMTMSTRCSENPQESAQIREFVKGIPEVAGKLALGEVLGPLQKFDLFGYGRKLRALMMRFDKLVDGIIMEHEKEGYVDAKGRKDMMDILLEISKDETAELQLTKKDVKALLLGIFLGGTDSTSVTLEWVLASLINNERVFKKLREEICNLVGASRIVEESDIPNLPYLQAVVKETLRLHPPLPLILRKCTTDCKINGYDLQADSRILINVYAIMHDKDTWENPDMFIPERFLDRLTMNYEGKKNVDIKGQRFDYLPFGSGRRGCPGSALSSAILHVTVGKLVQCFDWKTNGDEKVDLKEGSGFVSCMARPLMCYPLKVN